MKELVPDVLFIEPDSSRESYGDLATDYSAIEPPTWSLLLAESCRSKGYFPIIADQKAERLDDEVIITMINDLKPRLVVMVVYGQNPNSGTANMTGAQRLGDKITKSSAYNVPMGMIGSHISALPLETMDKHGFIDIGFLGDGVYALHTVLSCDRIDTTDFSRVPGIVVRNILGGHSEITAPGKMVPQERMDIDLPGYAWDLIPPLSEYRAHNWHPQYDPSRRSPFAAIYTSLGCAFKCEFCMINSINRSSSDSSVYAGMFSGMRYWSPEHMLKIFKELAEMGVETLRLSDEMFYLNRKYYEPILNGIIDRNLNFNMWAYTRVDTMKPKFLDLYKKAGVNLLCPGIEAASRDIRLEITKGKFQDVDIVDLVRQSEDHGIEVGANFIVGFPNEKIEDMQATRDLAFELNTQHMNVYTATNLPGSELHYNATRNGWKEPETYSGYSFLSYDYEAQPTAHVPAEEVLRFRDNMWHDYFTSENYLSMMKSKFGQVAVDNINNMTKIDMKRKMLGD
jgi:radical SAM superfamily enzyme YgiQ (UPF0313 family)